MALLRFATAGSVDDGKSTLIGRLLYESKSIFEDQLEAVERASLQRGYDYVNLALLTDGLRAERDQGITIDVAYRYFATPRRSFIVADTPGHTQYTRNMVTGASTADVAVVLVDARKGLVEQSRRHASVAALLRVPHLVVAVNKMDLVGWEEAAFRSIVAEFRELAARLGLADVVFIPMSALHGDNVVGRSTRMAWYGGPSLLEHLEEIPVTGDTCVRGLRFPVQRVVRPMSHDHHDYRGYAGQVAAGAMRVGDEVVVLPSGLRTSIAAIDTLDGVLEEAVAGMAVTVLLGDEVDVSRGDLLCDPGDRPVVTQQVEATVCWMGERPLVAAGRYHLKHTTRWCRAVVGEVHHRLDVNTLDHDATADELVLNDIGLLTLRTSQPLMVDAYARNRTTGSFILVDEATNATVGAGMLLCAAE